MTDERKTDNDVPTRDQFPHQGYRGYLKEKYLLLMNQDPKNANAYWNVLGALNDSTTEQARDMLRRQIRGGDPAYLTIYKGALQDLDEEEREIRGEREHLPTLWRASLRACDDPFFLGYRLAAYQKRHGLSDQDVAALLQCSLADLARLRLCRLPEEQELIPLIGRFAVSADVLAAIIGEG